MLGCRIRYFGEIFSPGFGAGYALPAFLNPVLRVALGGLMSLPALDIAARNAGVHDLADSAGLPLCRDIGVAQRFRIELFGTHPVTRVVLQKGIDHASLRILLHEVLLVGLQGFLHGRAKGQLIIAAVVDGHGFCPKLVDIGTGIFLVVQNVDFGQFRIHRDGDEAAVARAVTGQKILPIGRASKDALTQTVGRMGLVGDFIGFLLFAEKALDGLEVLQNVQHLLRGTEHVGNVLEQEIALEAHPHHFLGLDLPGDAEDFFCIQRDHLPFLVLADDREEVEQILNVRLALANKRLSP